MPSSSPPLLILIAPLRSSCALIGLERSFPSLQLSPSQQLAANYHLFCSCLSVYRHVGAFGGAVVFVSLVASVCCPRAPRFSAVCCARCAVALWCGLCLLAALSLALAFFRRSRVLCVGCLCLWFCCAGCPPWRCPGACSGARWRGSPWSWRLVCAVRWRRLSGRFGVRLLSLRVRSAAVCVSRRGAFRR